VALAEVGALVEPIDRGPHARENEMRGAHQQHAEQLAVALCMMRDRLPILYASQLPNRRT
jgi:hypothetical protein